MTGEASCAGFDIGGAGRVQLDGGLGKQLGDGACMAPAKRSCLFGCLAIGRGEAIFTGGVPSGALAYGATVSDANRFCLALGTTGVFCLRGICAPAFAVRRRVCRNAVTTLGPGLSYMVRQLFTPALANYFGVLATNEPGAARNINTFCNNEQQSRLARACVSVRAQ